MFGSAKISIHLSSQRIEVAHVVHDAIKATHAAIIDQQTSETMWSQDLEPLDELLAECIAALGLTGRLAADVFYTSPDAVVEVHSIPARGEAALRAAELALVEAVPFDSDTNPIAVAQIARDGGGVSSRTHVLAAADRDKNVVAICGWLARQGVRVKSICPIAACILNQVVCRATNEKSSTPSALIYLGETSTVIAVGKDRHIEFTRLISFGIQRLIESAARANRDEESCDLCQVASDVFACGVDFRNPGPNGPLPREMLAVLQPVLQRYLVEIKQTLRYASTDQHAAPERIVLMGPGASIPGFDSLLGEELQVEVTIADDCKNYEPTSPCSRGGEAYAEATGPRGILDFLPATVREDRLVKQIRVAISAGAAIAGLALAVEASSIIDARDEVRTAMTQEHASVEAVERYEATNDHAYALASAVAQSERSLNFALDNQPAWSILLAEIQRIGSDDIRLVEINGRVTPMGLVATINGLAISSTGADPLKPYMDSIKASPMVGAVALGSTRAVHSDGKRAKEFSLQITITGLPLWSDHRWETP